MMAPHLKGVFITFPDAALDAGHHNTHRATCVKNRKFLVDQLTPDWSSPDFTDSLLPTSDLPAQNSRQSHAPELKSNFYKVVISS